MARELVANTPAAEKCLRAAIELREALFRVLRAAAARETGASGDVRLLSRWNAEALRHRDMVGANRGYAWSWDDKPQLERIVWPIAQAAADLLTGEQLANVRECEAADCQWLFLDTSRNHSRRWCDMSACGNREKARRHYQRQHAEH